MTERATTLACIEPGFDVFAPFLLGCGFRCEAKLFPEAKHRFLRKRIGEAGSDGLQTGNFVAVG